MPNNSTGKYSFQIAYIGTNTTGKKGEKELTRVLSRNRKEEQCASIASTKMNLGAGSKGRVRVRVRVRVTL